MPTSAHAQLKTLRRNASEGKRRVCLREGRCCEIVESIKILVISSENMYGVSKLQEEVVTFVEFHGN